MNDHSTATSVGFGEFTLRLVGRHPFRVWLVAWLSLAWAWLLVQVAVGVPWALLSHKPPPRNLIRYADLDGKQTPSGIVLRFPEAVLAADPATSPLAPYSDVQFGDHEGRAVITAQKMTRFECGWPLPLFSAQVWSAWDVTDPEKGFVPAAGIFPRPQHGLEAAGIVWMSADDAKSLRLHLQRAGVWSPVVVAAIPIAPVSLLWLIHAARQRRRRLRGACLSCGHARGPAPVSLRCHECGTMFEAGSQASDVSGLKHALRSARLPAVWLLLWLTVASAVFAVFWLNAREHAIDEAEIRENAEFRVSYAQQEGLTTPGESGLRVSERRIGWPWPIVTIEKWRWYAVNRDASYVPVPVDPDIEFRDERAEWDFCAFDNDPFVLNWYLVDWRPGVLIFAVTAFVAGNILMVGLWMCGCRSQRSVHGNR